VFPSLDGPLPHYQAAVSKEGERDQTVTFNTEKSEKSGRSKVSDNLHTRLDSLNLQAATHVSKSFDLASKGYQG